MDLKIFRAFVVGLLFYGFATWVTNPDILTFIVVGIVAAFGNYILVK